MILCNVRKYMPSDKAAQPRRPESSATLLSKPQTLQTINSYHSKYKASPEQFTVQQSVRVHDILDHMLLFWSHCRYLWNITLQISCKFHINSDLKTGYVSRDLCGKHVLINHT